MNEPTDSVDIESRQVIWKSILSLRNKATIISSHAHEEAEPVSSLFFIVAGGKLTFQGISIEFRSQYRCDNFMIIHSP
jgi:ABC-type multidrug transport system ATPase subunit